MLDCAQWPITLPRPIGIGWLYACSIKRGMRDCASICLPFPPGLVKTVGFAAYCLHSPPAQYWAWSTGWETNPQPWGKQPRAVPLRQWKVQLTINTALKLSDTKMVAPWISLLLFKHDIKYFVHWSGEKPTLNGRAIRVECKLARNGSCRIAL